MSPAEPDGSGTAAVLTVIPGTSPQARGPPPWCSGCATRQCHGRPVPTGHTGVTVLVGGETAASIDTAALISRHLAIVVAFVIALSVPLLMAAFRSVFVPLISAGMTLIPTIAAYGAIVAVFQWGWLGSGVDAGATAPVGPWIALMLFALLFGFSMDYRVFLVSRIRDEWLGGASDSDAVANGLAATGRIITSAAAIMICVFGAFVLGDLRVLRVIGFGMAVAVLLDATLVRMVAIPAALRLAGRANWWFPRWLDRVIPSFLPEVRAASSQGGSDMSQQESLPLPGLLTGPQWPLPSRFLTVGKHAILYIDTGQGPTLLFVQTAAWSFIWRDVISRLHSSFRCVALDFPAPACPARQLRATSGSAATPKCWKKSPASYGSPT